MVILIFQIKIIIQIIINQVLCKGNNVKTTTFLPQLLREEIFWSIHLPNKNTYINCGQKITHETTL